MSTITIGSGVVSSGLAVSGGVTLLVNSGGRVVSGTVLSGGTEIVSRGGIASAMTISAGASDTILGGGVAIATTDYGAEYVSSGGVASGTTAISGNQWVSSGGVASGTTIFSGGGQVVSSGGTASNTLVGAGGYQMLEAGAVAVGVTVSGTSGNIASQGVLASGISGIVVGPYTSQGIGSGGVVINEQVESGGSANLYYSGTFSGGVISAFGGLSAHSIGAAIVNVLDGGYLVVSYGSATNTTVISGGDEILLSSGLAVSTTISSGGLETVSSGGEAFASMVKSGGAIVALSGGIVSGGVVSGHGLLVSAPGAILRGPALSGGTTVSSGVVDVVSGSVIYATTISGATIGSGGNQFVLPGGDAISAAISGGEQMVFSAGIASGTTLSAGATQTVSSGSIVNGTVVGSGATQMIVLGASPSATTVYSGGYQIVSSGAIASGTVLSGGYQTVSSGGAADDTTISAGGTQDLKYLAQESRTTVASGGFEVVSYGAVGSNNTVETGGTIQVVSSGGLLNALIYSGGFVTLSSGSLVNDATLIGTLVVSSGGTASNVALQPGGVLDARASGTVTGLLSFPTGGGVAVLRLGASATLNATVLDFAAGNAIDFTALAYQSGTTAVVSGGTLEVVAGASMEAITLGFGSVADGTVLDVFDDGAGGTEVACFAAGTRIATAEGERAVEALRPGETVLLAGGGVAAVRWLGHRRVATARHPRPHDIMPVRVRAGAFADGMPRRDLVLSPDHAVFVDGVLIPVRYLLNGATVVQETVPSVEYWHLELPAHDVVLAEGLACESYLDTGNRAAFAEGAVIEAHPKFARGVWEVAGCAPLVLAGPVLAAVRARLLARLPALGFRLTQAPALRFEADGAVLEAQRLDGAWCLALPDGARRLTILSRATRAAQTDPASDDWRDLGVALFGLRLDGRRHPLDSARLLHGWHAPEPRLRWSDGAGVLDVTGVAVAELWLAAAHGYVVTLDEAA